MTTAALPQIDENYSLVQSHGNAALTLPLPLPTLLANSTAQIDGGEKTPDLVSRRLSLGDCGSPHPWTPTPQARRQLADPDFSIGEQTPDLRSGKHGLTTPLADTPLAWPEYAPSFHIDTHQPISFSGVQGAPMTLPSHAMQGLTMMTPMMLPGQMACPMGMVMDANMLSAANMGANVIPPLPFSAASSMASAGGLVHKAAVSKVPSVDLRTPPKAKPPVLAKKTQRSSNPNASASDECPVAVYVDLSGLKERSAPPSRANARR
jgi:hypothetical protein